MKSRPVDVACIAARVALCVAIMVLQGCGGGGGGEDGGTAANAVPEKVSEDTSFATDATSSVASSDNCLVVPAAPAATTADNTRSVSEFGAVPNDSGDDTIAIQRALDAMKAGQVLNFPAGRYLTNKRLRVRVAGTTLNGAGATLHATNPDDQALIIEADDVTVRSFFMTAVTDVRRSAPWHARIAVYAENADATRKIIRRSVIQDNTITHAGAPGSPGANGASSAGILLLRAEGFLVSGNTVVRTLADGIHVTSGSRNGRIMNNTVRETGDDMIAVVSYAGDGPAALGSAAQTRVHLAERLESQLNRNILISGNKVSGQYWGRGISVVGGRDISVRRNTLDNIPLASGILVAREASYESFGVDNVLVEGNTITNVQTRTPPYDVDNKFASHRPTGHGAIEIHASLFDDEAADPQLKSELSVRNVKVIGNTVRVTSVPGVRAGVAFDATMQADSPDSGAKVSRHLRTSSVQTVSVQTTRLDSIVGAAMNMEPAGLIAGSLHCRANTRDGQAYSDPACVRAEPTVNGAPLVCLATGKTS